MKSQSKNYLYLLYTATLLCVLVSQGLWFSLPALSHDAELQKEEISIDGKERTYFLHFPNKNRLKKMLPVVIVLHGGMENARVISKMTRMNELADSQCFLAVYPEGSGRLKSKFLTWNAVGCCGYALKEKIDDVKFIEQLIDSLHKRYETDKKRVFVTGFSNGAMLALRLACELSDKIAAVASVGGSMSGKECMPNSPVSVLLIHGTKDKHVPYNGGKGKWARFGYPVNEMSVSYALEFWKKANSCTQQAEKIEAKDARISEAKCGNADGKMPESKMEIESYAGKNGTEIRLISLLGARHTWPGGRQSLLYSDKEFRGLDASKECWQFFQMHPKN